MTVKECSQIIAKLRAENKPENAALISYYEKAIEKTVKAAAEKALARAFGVKR